MTGKKMDRKTVYLISQVIWLFFGNQNKAKTRKTKKKTVFKYCKAKTRKT